MTRTGAPSRGVTRRPGDRSIQLLVSPVEYTVIAHAAQREGVSLANYLRRCVNSALLDGEGEVFVHERIARARWRFTSQEQARIRQLRSYGLSLRQITQRLGPHSPAVSTVRRYLEA